MGNHKNRCGNCEYVKEIKAQDNYSFAGCFKEPYKGKPADEIEICPIEGNTQMDYTLRDRKKVC